MTTSITLFNGRPADAGDLASLAFAGYAHFTAMQVRDLHLARLRGASDELFGRHLPDETIIEHLRSALATAPPDVSLTCYISARPGEFASAGGAVDLDVLVKVTDEAAPPPGRSPSTPSSTSGIFPVSSTSAKCPRRSCSGVRTRGDSMTPCSRTDRAG